MRWKKEKEGVLWCREFVSGSLMGAIFFMDCSFLCLGVNGCESQGFLDGVHESPNFCFPCPGQLARLCFTSNAMFCSHQRTAVPFFIYLLYFPAFCGFSSIYKQ